MVTTVLAYDEFNNLHVTPDQGVKYVLTPDTDVSGMDNKIQAAAAEFWTDEIKQGYQAHLAVKQAELAKWDSDAQARANQTSLRYLRETDWHAIRFAETGEPIPSEISTARQAARKAIV